MQLRHPTHTMYDSVDLSQIPADARYIAGYVDGNWPTYETIRARWHRARVLSIAVTAAHDAECLDVELGDATPAQAPGWAWRQLARGATRPCIYASLSVMPAVIAAMSRAGLHRTVYRLWVAHYIDQQPREVPAGYGAIQWTCHARGRNLDQSLTVPGFFNARP